MRSLLDKYPLYSEADEALYLLGQAYEGEIAMVRSKPGNETAKARMIQEFTKDAADAYSRILTRYPMMNRTDDAKARLQALHQPVPKATKAAIAQNKAEEDSRRESSTVSKVLRNFQKHPDVAQASRVGEPTLVDPQVVSATSVVQEATRAMMGSAAPGDNSVAIETVGKGPLQPDQPAPRSDSPAPETTAVPAANPGANPGTSPDSATPDAAAQDTNELKPNVAPDPNELKPNVDNSAPAAPAPTQVNEIQNGADNPGTNAPAAAGSTKPGDGASSSSASSADDKDEDPATSSSKHKKKKGLRKVVPF